MSIKNENNRINQIIQTAIQNINSMVDVNTVIGSPINTNKNEVIIPFSKVTLAVLSGGGEYGKLNIFSKGDLPLSAGNGALVSIKPSGFLVKGSGETDYKIYSVSENPYEKILDKTGEILESLTENKND